MKIVEPEIKILSNIDLNTGIKILKNIERIGRTCYKSENNISSSSARKFVSNIISNGHESVLEHESLTVKIICDRGVSHEIVRHRLASFSQESTRYCNYSKDKFGKEITVVKPSLIDPKSYTYKVWKKACEDCENSYFKLLENGWKPEQARSVLPNSLKTEIVVTMNLREWRHFFKLRCSPKAHPDMRYIANRLLDCFKFMIPIVFDDINMPLNDVSPDLVAIKKSREKTFNGAGGLVSSGLLINDILDNDEINNEICKAVNKLIANTLK